MDSREPRATSGAPSGAHSPLTPDRGLQCVGCGVGLGEYHKADCPILWGAKPPTLAPDAPLSFKLGETWPDWFAVLHINNIAFTWNREQRWGGGPDFCECRRPDGSVTHRRRGEMVSITDFLPPQPEIAAVAS